MRVGVHFHDFEDIWRMQRDVHAAVVSGSLPPTVLILEHAQVLTAGSRTQPGDLPTDGSPVVDVDRGGRITWHGPGQLVCYPIVPLPHPLDVAAHVRRLESVAIKTCADFNVPAGRIPGLRGAWASPQPGEPGGKIAKIAAVGVRVSHGTTMHGLALNVDCDLSWARRIVPCGIPDADVTSLVRSSGRPTTTLDVLPRFIENLRTILEPAVRCDAVNAAPA